MWTPRGRPASGYLTKRGARAWLDDLLASARRGVLPGMVRTGATVADASAEWLRWAEHERACKPTTLTDYRYTVRRLDDALGEMRLEDVTARPGRLTASPCLTETRGRPWGTVALDHYSGVGRRRARRRMVLGSLMMRVARSGRFWLMLLLAGLLSVVSAGPSAAADGTCTFDTTTGQTTCTFASTGQEQAFKVPADVSSLSVLAKGAAGANGGANGSPGGEGAVVSGTLSVGPQQPVMNGQILYVEVGGEPTGGDCGDVNCVGGFNGGGLSREGGGGGGASDVRTSPLGDSGTLTTRLLVAAGGGGSGGDQACDSTGGAGGNAEEAGMTGCDGGGSGGQPGTSTMGGAGGSPAGTNGGLGIGGGSSRRVGGGGGGGLYGGGSGGEPRGEPDSPTGAGGGGGGSNLVPAGWTSGLTADPPQIAITYASLGEQHAALLASATGVGPGKSLANKARQIQAAADANNKAGACATLAAFVHEVAAQTGKKLTAEQAASLTTQAENIQATLSC